MILLLLSLLAWGFTVRRSSNFTPARPRNSFNRPGYQETPSNPHGYHRAVDIPAPKGQIKQAPERCRIAWKGWFGDLGLVIELQILDGYDKGRFVRMCHCSSVSAYGVGHVFAKRAAVARVGCTGNCSGNHEHEELGRYRLIDSRDPRWDLTERVQNAWDHDIG